MEERPKLEAAAPLPHGARADSTARDESPAFRDAAPPLQHLGDAALVLSFALLLCVAAALDKRAILFLDQAVRRLYCWHRTRRIELRPGPRPR